MCNNGRNKIKRDEIQGMTMMKEEEEVERGEK